MVAPGLSLRVFKLIKSCCTCTLVCIELRALPLIVAASAERLCSDAGRAPAAPGSPAAQLVGSAASRCMHEEPNRRIIAAAMLLVQDLNAPQAC